MPRKTNNKSEVVTREIQGMTVGVSIYPVKKGGKLLASANVTIMDSFVLKGFKVINAGTKTKEKWFVANNSSEFDGEYYDNFYILDDTVREELHEFIIEETVRAINA